MSRNVTDYGLAPDYSPYELGWRMVLTAKAIKSSRTQNRIIDVATTIFARDGYADAALSEIVSSAGITTGAVYHHFGGKKGLFIAVAEHLEQVILDDIRANVPLVATDWDRFESGIMRALETCARPDIQRIVFRDAPTVVGHTEWREIEIKYSLGVMRNSISDLMAVGLIDAQNADLTAQILLGAVIEAAHITALSPKPKLALSQSQDAIRKILSAFRSH